MEPLPDRPLALVLHDSPEIRENLVRALREEGWDALCPSGVGAILPSLKGERPTRLVLTGEAFDGMDSWRLCRLIRRFHSPSSCPIVLLSSFHRTDPPRAEGPEAEAVLPFPLDQEALRAILRNPSSIHRPGLLLFGSCGNRLERLRERLETGGYSVFHASLLGQALTLLEKEHPELVLLDPGMEDPDSLAPLLTRLSARMPFLVMEVGPAESQAEWLIQGARNVLPPHSDPELILAHCDRTLSETAHLRPGDVQPELLPGTPVPYSAPTRVPTQALQTDAPPFLDSWEGMGVVDIPSGTFQACNPALMFLSGFSEEELRGMPLRRLLPPLEADGILTGLLAPKESPAPLQLSLLTRSGEHRECRIRTVTMERGKTLLLFQDISEKLKIRREKELTEILLRLLCSPGEMHALLHRLTMLLQEWTTCSAVGIRLQQGEDYPYFETSGFSKDFVELESSLCQRDRVEGAFPSTDGEPELECMCGHVLQGRTNPDLPFFTRAGTFWTNCTTGLAATADELGWQPHLRNRCCQAGYESVALIPIRTGTRTFGLLQFNDRRKDRFSPDLIHFLESIARQIALTLAQRMDQQALLQEESRYRILFETLSQGVLLHDREGDVLAANAAARTILGLSLEEMREWTKQGRDWDAIREDGAPFPADELPHRITNRTGLACPSAILGFIHPIGNHRVWIRAHSAPLFQPESSLPYQVYTIFEDITVSLQAEQALRASEEKYRLLVENAHEAIYVVQNGCIRFANSACSRFSGMSREELLGRNVRDFLGPEEYSKLLQANEIVPTQIIHRKERDFHVILPDGSSRWLRVNTVGILWEGAPAALNIGTDITSKHAAEEAFRRSEARFRRCFELPLIGMGILSPEGGWLECNDRLCAMLGARKEELPSLNWLSCTHPEDRPDEESLFQSLLLGIREHYTREKRLLHKTGKTVWVSQAVGCVRSEENRVEYLVVLLHDISDRKAVETELRRRESRGKALLESMPDMIFVLTEQGQIIDYQAGPSSRLLLPPEAFLGKVIEEILPPNITVPCRNLLEQIRLTGQPTSYEYSIQQDCLRHYESRLVPTEPGEYLAIVRDITDRKRAEETLRASEERYRLLFENMTSGFALHEVLYDAQGKVVDYRFLEANPAFERLTGVPVAGLVGKTVRQVMPGIEAHWIETYEEVVKTGIPKLFSQFAQEIGRHYSSLAFRPAPNQFAVIFNDVTEQVEAREQLAQLNRELEQRIRERTGLLMAANHELESFTYSVSHDLRAPLRAIDGFSQILAESCGSSLDEDGAGLLRRIRENAQRMGGLIDDLLRLSRLSRSELNPCRVDLSSLATRILTELRDLEPERPVELVLAPGLSVTADPGLMRILLENLLRNAWKFTSHHPRARIELGSFEKEGETVHFVKDDGAGFDMSYSHKLFGVFQRLHYQEEFPGSGIGLATAQRIVHRHGGRIWAEGAPEKGATIFFTLPERELPPDD